MEDRSRELITNLERRRFQTKKATCSFSIAVPISLYSSHSASLQGKLHRAHPAWLQRQFTSFTQIQMNVQTSQLSRCAQTRGDFGTLRTLRSGPQHYRQKRKTKFGGSGENEQEARVKTVNKSFILKIKSPIKMEIIHIYSLVKFNVQNVQFMYTNNYINTLYAQMQPV